MIGEGREHERIFSNRLAGPQSNGQVMWATGPHRQARVKCSTVCCTEPQTVDVAIRLHALA
jgi:hypothetical protein